MNLTRVQDSQKEWMGQVRYGLLTEGYYYEPSFSSETDDVETFVMAARLLGDLDILPDTDRRRPVILTKPSRSAPQWRPFDRGASIGWHNDFSTRARRPELSLSWIREQDPTGPNGGAWRVASVSTVIEKLCETRDGGSLVAGLSRNSEPFGYRDTGGWRPFRVIGRDRKSDRREMRFYGRALMEGASLRFGEIPKRTREIVDRVEKAADAVGEVLPATTGALLIVDNRFSLHDRLEQRVTGHKECRRQAWLCFVSRLHQPL